MSKPSSSAEKKPAIQAGIIVGADYGPLILPLTRACAIIRGLVLKGHTTKGHWLVHWFYIRKTAAVPVGQLYVPPNADLVQKQFVEGFLKNPNQNYIGNAEDLKNYVDNQRERGSSLKRNSVATVSPPAKVARTTKPIPLKSKSLSFSFANKRHSSLPTYPLVTSHGCSTTLYPRCQCSLSSCPNSRWRLLWQRQWSWSLCWQRWPLGTDSCRVSDHPRCCFHDLQGKGSFTSGVVLWQEKLLPRYDDCSCKG